MILVASLRSAAAPWFTQHCYRRICLANLPRIRPRCYTSHSPPADSPPPPTTPPPAPPPSQASIVKQSVPEHYPQVLALPIARRPLFPGFYKAVVVRNPAVVSAIKEMMQRGQPYLGAFLLKDENTDSDVITDINSVHSVGVFAQITSVFAAASGREDDKEEGLTAVLYPHRRIKITQLVKAGVAKVDETEPEAEVLPTPPPSPEPHQEELVTQHPRKSSTLLCPAFVRFTTGFRSTTPNLLPAQVQHFHCPSRQSHHTALQQR